MTGRARATTTAKSAAKSAAKKAPAKKPPAKKASAPAAAKSATAKKSAAKAAVRKAPAAKAAAKPVAKAVPTKAVARAATKASAAAKGAARPATKTAAKKAAARPAQVTKSVAPGKGADWTARDLAKIRKELVAEIGQMQAEYDSSLAELTELQSSSADGAGDDQADAGSKTFEREQELSIAANRFDLLSQMQRAVERIDAGTYGYCERCGRPIPRVRLQAFPMATLDVECKQREERR